MKTPRNGGQPAGCSGPVEKLDKLAIKVDMRLRERRIPGNINSSSEEEGVGVSDGVFLVTANIWFWCLGAVFKKDDFSKKKKKAKAFLLSAPFELWRA